MLMRTLRSPQPGKSLAALAGFILAGPTVLAQYPDAGVRHSPVTAQPQAAYGQTLEEPSLPGQVPRVAQTPQVPSGSTFSDLTGAITAPAPLDYTTPGGAGVTPSAPTTAGAAPAPGGCCSLASAGVSRPMGWDGSHPFASLTAS